MKIETKFDYFSKVYTMLDNKVYSFEVEKIEIYISPKSVGIADRIERKKECEYFERLNKGQ